jgi:hypothetical protein
MIPDFGQILSSCLIGANTPALARAGISTALFLFWQDLINHNCFASFDFTGSAIIPPTTVPVTGMVGGFATGIFPYIPTDKEIKSALATKPNVWKGFFKLFEYTIRRTLWYVDCKAASYSTPYLAKLTCTTVNTYAPIFQAKMFGRKPNSQEAAMKIIDEGVKEFLQTVINVVPYVGAGAGELTGSMTVAFNPHI